MLSPAEEATSKDEVELEKLSQAQKSKNTQYKTKSDLNPWMQPSILAGVFKMRAVIIKWCRLGQWSKKPIPNTLCGSQIACVADVIKPRRKRQQNTYQIYGGHQRTFQPKAYVSKNESRCQVEFYKAIRSHRSEAFYLAINHRRKPNDKVWYLDRPLGKFLKAAFAAAKLDDTNEKVSNHSVRKTSIGRLLEANFQPNFVTQLSDRKNLKSLDSYHSA